MTALTQRQHELVFQARMNISYHESLERFYGQWLNWTSFTSLIFSSAAFAALGNLLPITWQPFREMIVGSLAFVIACLNGSVLAFGMRTKMSTHADLKKKWMLFLSRAQLDAGDGDPINKLEREFHELNAQEPAPNRRRLEHAYQEACKSLGLTPAGPPARSPT